VLKQETGIQSGYGSISEFGEVGVCPKTEKIGNSSALNLWILVITVHQNLIG
jgi:hypothetical protein